MLPDFAGRIGFAIVSRLAADGAKVVISSRKQENVNRAVSELKAKGFQDVLGVKCHVGDGEDRNNLFKQTVDRFGGLDILVSNAAVNPAVGVFSFLPFFLTCSSRAQLLFVLFLEQVLCWIAVKTCGTKSLTST